VPENGGGDSEGGDLKRCVCVRGSPYDEGEALDEWNDGGYGGLSPDSTGKRRRVGSLNFFLSKSK